MPGSRLNGTERALVTRWQNDNNLLPFTLKRISIIGNPGLRGIKSLTLNINYPLTVISGRNGSGKTTILATCALGFHTIDGHFPRGAKLSEKRGATSAYLRFSDFFYKGPQDPDLSGIEISWTFANGNTKSCEKKDGKWMNYNSRPARAVHYLGIARTLPAIEQYSMRNHFSARKRRQSRVVLSEDYLNRLSDIMGRRYTAASEFVSKNYRLHTCHVGAPYSGFNMGAGEDILIDILGILQEAPEGAMIIIEEIELGLHPAALAKLAKHLQEIILIKNMQIIVSTHSRFFLDAVPRQARVHVMPGENLHEIRYEPTTRFAMSLMHGHAEPELIVFCEDRFAEEVIRRALSGEQRSRTNIVSVGSESELAREAQAHLRSNPNVNHLILWDGDMTEARAQQFIQNQNNADQINFEFISDEHPPELFVLHILNQGLGLENIEDRFGLNNVAEARQLVNSLLAEQDHHNIGFVASNQLNIELHDAIIGLIDCAFRTNQNSFIRIREIVERRLNGEVVRGQN